MKLRGRTEGPALGAEGAQFLSARGDSQHRGASRTPPTIVRSRRHLEDSPLTTVRARHDHRRYRPVRTAKKLSPSRSWRSCSRHTVRSAKGHQSTPEARSRRCVCGEAQPLESTRKAIRTRRRITPNGEVEGPHRSPSPWRRGRTISSRPRHQAARASRAPSTIVRSRCNHSR